MEIPTDYITQQFYTYCKRPIYKKSQGTYNAECPVCKEGKSSGLKRRLFYFPREHYFYCFNCTKSWSELNWLKEVTGESASTILKDANAHIVDLTNTITSSKPETDERIVRSPGTLPFDSIDIFDKQQLEHAKKHYSTKSAIFDCAVQYCKHRHIDVAINRPKSLYLSLSDYTHANRLIIPFYDVNDRLYTFQSRSLLSNSYPKYITKPGDKCLYGENTLTDDIPYIFVLEGPIDAMFIPNGVAVGGSSITQRQQETLYKHFEKQIIYIFDNDKSNAEMNKVVLSAIKSGKTVFNWPKELSKHKDINDVCCYFNINKIDPNFIIKNSFTGVEAEVKYRTRS